MQLHSHSVFKRDSERYSKRDSDRNSEHDSERDPEQGSEQDSERSNAGVPTGVARRLLQNGACLVGRIISTAAEATTAAAEGANMVLWQARGYTDTNI